MKDVDTKSPKAFFGQGEVDFELASEVLHLLRVHKLEGRLLDHLRRHFELVDRHDLAFDLDLGGRKWRKEKIRGLFLYHQLE